jgi:hypothetical protein
MPSSRGFKVSPWGIIAVVSVCCKFGYQIFWLVTLSCSWRRMRNNGGDIVACIGQFPSVMVALSTKTVKVATQIFFASKR